MVWFGDRLTRRRFLVAGVAMGAVALEAGCSANPLNIIAPSRDDYNQRLILSPEQVDRLNERRLARFQVFKKFLLANIDVGADFQNALDNITKDNVSNVYSFGSAMVFEEKPLGTEQILKLLVNGQMALVKLTDWPKLRGKPTTQVLDFYIDNEGKFSFGSTKDATVTIEKLEQFKTRFKKGPKIWQKEKIYDGTVGLIGQTRDRRTHKLYTLRQNQKAAIRFDTY